VGELGVDGLLVVSPYYNKPNNSGMLRHFSEVCEHTDLPIILYNVPSRTGKNINTDIILELVNNFPNIRAVKEASGDLNQIMDLANQLPNRVSLLSGDDALTLPIMSVGGKGCVSVVANHIPNQFSELVDMASKGDFREARVIHDKIYQLMKANFVETNPVPVKYIMHKQGLIENSYCRSPLGPLTRKNQDYLDNLINEMGL
jgi:4-hydroxy-tetrahydrodipicolinate synthase